MQKAMENHTLTSKELVLLYFSRIAELDKSINGLNAILELNPDALFIADVLDLERARGELRGPLHGIPVLLKDNINTADKLHTSAGSLALADNFAPYDAYIVKRLRQAGAIILGKTNLTEFANYMTENMPNGYSSRGGQVLCPYNLEVDPSGSSSGSAVAVAANLCAVSVGTETWGSITSPSQRNGIVGIKPTMGLVSRTGIIPISNTLDTAGPMARTVQDAAILLGVLVGEDSNDSATQAAGVNQDIDYTQYLDVDGLKGARIGINRNDIEQEGEEVAFQNVLHLLKDAGAEIIEGINIEPTKNIMDFMKYEFKLCMNSYLSSINNPLIKTLHDIIRFNQEHEVAALKYGQSILLDAEYNTSGRCIEPEYLNVIKERDQAIKSLDRVFEKHQLDVILSVSHMNIAPFTGFPSMTIPIGCSKNNLPIGSYWVARRYDEASLLRVTYGVEQRLKGRCKPKL